MINITVLPQNKKYSVKNEILLSDFLQKNGFLEKLPCGGKGICGKCAVKVSGILSKITEFEIENIDDGYRLSCVTTVKGNCIVFLEETDFVELAFPKDLLKGEYSLAVDIGTTTIQVAAVDENKNYYIFPSILNPQLSLGPDVISRIEAASDSDNLKKMQNGVYDILENYVKIISNEKLLFSGNIHISANSTMEYIALGKDPSSIGLYPYSIDENFPYENSYKFKELNISMNLLKSGFLGGDFLGGVQYYIEEFKPDSFLFMDLGTNGEILLKHENNYLAASCAMGPALEGYNITYGTVFSEGAATAFNSQNGFSVEGDNEKFFGITGTCLIDLIAYFLDEGIISFDGEILEGNEIFKVVNECGIKKLYLNDKVYISNNDIRNFQLAKSALCTAIEILLKESNITLNNLKTIVVAGSFGNNLNFENFMKCGFLPSKYQNEKEFIKNSSLFSAIRAINEQNFHNSINCLKDKINVVYLENNLEFSNSFINNLNFFRNDNGIN